MALTITMHQHWDDAGWRDESACRDLDPDLFFPVGVTGPAIEQIEAAKSLCTECPVQVDCLEFALATNQEYGVWGGTTEDERRVIRRRRRQAMRAAAARAS